jgi:hypothetical protein
MPETERKLNEMVQEANRRYPAAQHGKGTIIDLLFAQIGNPLERQREKCAELQRQLMKETDTLNSMESTQRTEEIKEKKKIFVEEEQ